MAAFTSAEGGRAAKFRRGLDLSAQVIDRTNVFVSAKFRAPDHTPPPKVLSSNPGRNHDPRLCNRTPRSPVENRGHSHRKRRGVSKPETFNFLGFVLICDKSRRGAFRVMRSPGAIACAPNSEKSRKRYDDDGTSPSRKRASGLHKSSAAISPITPCRQTARR